MNLNGTNGYLEEKVPYGPETDERCDDPDRDVAFPRHLDTLGNEPP